MKRFSTETVEVLGYDVKVEDSGLCVNILLDEEEESYQLSLYPEESKALRKALKRAEKRVVGK